MFKEITLAIALANQPLPTLNPTDWLRQSLQIVYTIHKEICKKLSIKYPVCENILIEEINHIRQYVNTICSQMAPPDSQNECQNEWIEYILDNKIIPEKQHKSKSIIQI